MAQLLPIQTQPFTLYGNGVVIGATSLTLTSFNDINGVAIPFQGTVMTGTIEPGNGSNEEQIIFTGLTTNTNGTVTLTGVSSVAFASPYTLTSGVVKSHFGNTTFTLSDTAYLYSQYASLGANNVFTGTDTFNISPFIPTVSSTATGQAASVGYVNSVAISGAPKASNTVFGITQLSVAPVLASDPIAVGQNDPLVSPVSLATLTAGEVAALAGTSGTPGGGNLYVTNNDTAGTGAINRASITNAQVKFGGTGADGALTITSGTTTIALGGASIVVKNYTSISITGTGKLAFSGPGTNGTEVILKSQGAVTLTSSTAPMIDLTGMGGAGGAIATAGTAGFSTLSIISTAGNGASAGTPGAVTTSQGSLLLAQTQLYNRITRMFTGGGGGGGSTGTGATGAGGVGGAGAGALVIECAGALNFTTASGISVAGTVGSVGSTASNIGGGGGGGGAGGSCLILYNTLTSASGTITVSGGAGGNGGSGGSSSVAGTGGAGGNGSSGTGQGGAGVLGADASGGSAGGGGGGSDSGLSSGSTGTNGSASSGNPGGGGGGGASGYGLVTQNVYFA